MVTLVLYIAVSADGYIATTDGGVAWLSPFENSGEDYGYETFYNSIDAIIMGSRTYEQLLTFGDWPYPEKTCYVCSHQTRTPDHRVTFLNDEPPTWKTMLQNRDHQRVWLLGGAAMVNTCLRHKLIDESMLFMAPVLLGDGIALFQAPNPKQDLQLLASQIYPSGMIMLHYGH